MTDGSIQTCQICGEPLALREGQEFEPGHFDETYKCSRGHVGTYEYEHGRESYTGALEAKR